MTIHVAALYQFKKIVMSESMRQQVYETCRAQKVLGTLLMGNEGINGTISGERSGLVQVIATLQAMGFDQLELKYSYAEETPFLRLKVIWKKEIVTLGLDVDPCQLVGEYVSPKDWNALISQEDILLIDTRNNYEYELGTFKGAVNPDTESFREFPRFCATIDREKYQRVAMFCTGGIRCEKASSYMLSLGFEKVYHLRGGILQYLEEISKEDSLWEGSCFVFDRRVALTHGLVITGLKQCYACRRALTAEDRAHASYVKGVSCPHCVNITSKERQAAFLNRQQQVDRALKRNQHHIGDIR